MQNLVIMGKVLLNPFSCISSLLIHYFYAHGLNANPNFDNVVGTLLQACSWAHANPIVVEHITLLSTMSDYRQQNLELMIRDRLSVADAIALVHHLGVTKAAAFVAAADPWRFPHDDAASTFHVQSYVHSVVAKATLLGKTLCTFTDIVSQLSFSHRSSSRRATDLLLFLNLRAKEASHLQKQLSLQLQPLRGNQALNLSIIQSLKVCTFRTFASLFPTPPHHPISLLSS